MCDLRGPLPTPVLAGNWKMFKGPEDAAAFFDAFLPAFPPRDDRTVLFFPPAISIAAARTATAARRDIGIGAQNIHWQDSGALTGEISAPMVAQAGCGYVLVGHSERRHVFGESDDAVARKTVAALRAGLRPVVCVGETLDERRAGQLEAVLLAQLDAVLDAISPTDAAALLLAYEPVWAIGTGHNATPADAAAAHALLRSRLEHRNLDASLPILYGGSVKPDNAADLLAAPDVDGLLVGGASLDPAGFAKIAASAPSATG